MPPPPPPSVTTGASGGSGLLQEFRKKIGKYAASPTSTPGSSPRVSGHEPINRRPMLLSPRPHQSTKVGGDLTHRIGRFEEHDALLQQLELQLSDMLAQLNGACRAMGSVVEVFTQTFRYDAASYRVGIDYLSAMKQMRRERAHLMEQALRFTVLDPLASRLARHAVLQERISAWRQLQRDVEKEESKKWTDFVARDARLAALRQQLDELERELGEALDHATNSTAVHQQVDLFTTMRLQLATFFYHTNYSLFSRLSATEAEIVVGVGPSPRSPVAGAVATRILPAETISNPEDALLEIGGGGNESRSPRDTKPMLTASDSFAEADSDEVDAAEEDEDEQRESITLEEFGLGALMPVSPEPAATTKTRRPILSTKAVPVPELLALASHPVVDALRVDDDEERIRRRHQAKQFGGLLGGSNSGTLGDSSVFSALRKSFNEKFSSSPRGSERSASIGSTPPLSPTNAVAIPQAMRRRVVASPNEWASVEATLWAMDTVHVTPDCVDASTALLPTLATVLQLDSVIYALSGFVCFPSLARLSNTNRRIHSRLRQCPALWKRSIRLGGLTRTTRSAVWLSILYGGTPWLPPSDTTTTAITMNASTNTSVPHHLKSRDQRKKIYEGLLVKLGTRIADGLLQTSFDEDSDDVDTARLVVWLREIDVDVVRTCSRAIYATKNATPAEVLSSYRALLEATIRRVLRAYVMYNPRVGYCQGMNFLVRLLMEVCCGEADEADCFWLFVGLCEPENDRNLYEPGLAVLQPLFVRFEGMLSMHKPQLHAHFQCEGVPVAAYTARWFLTFFSACETFDASVVIRILDAFAIDGWRVIFGMAIVVLDELEPQLLAAEMEAILRILQSPRDRLGDRDWVEQIVRRGLAYSLPRRLAAPGNQATSVMTHEGQT